MFPLKSKILVVDDSNSVRMLIVKCLRNLGYTEIVEATDGTTAWQVLEISVATQSPVQLILTDWNMPHMRGLELLERCRQHEQLRKVPVIMITSESQMPHIVAALKSGVSGYIVKPFSEDTLRSKLETIWSRFSRVA
jgi:two-component system chemotaxis response regulator CheY